MRHYDYSTVHQLKEKAKQLYQHFHSADQWISANLRYEERNQTLLRIKHGRRQIRKIVNSIDTKPVFALFGASQVGKSYLVKNLLSIQGAPLEIQLEGQAYDFLRDINPPGVGAESTGVVTRFSIDTHPSPAGFPVRVKLLTIKDVIIILCDSFFSDVKKIESYPSKDEFEFLLSTLEDKAGQGNFRQDKFLEEDILDIEDYFQRHFYKMSHLVERIDSVNYWLRLCLIIPSLEAKYWPKAFSILWDNQSEISALFEYLVGHMTALDFQDVLFAPSDAVLRGKGEMLDVQRLKELMQPTQEQINVTTAEGHSIRMPLAALSALSKEVTLTIPSSIAEEKPFLKNTDLLDFPGARSRLELNYESLTSLAIPDMFLRGKVAYLFNKYSADFEVNNLLFCQNDKQLDVNEIPSLLSDWINTNIGKTAEDRGRSIQNLSISPLFVVFTFFNNQLKFDTTNDDQDIIDYKWNTRFDRFFEQEIVTSSHDWHVNWTDKNPVFNNFYLLRDYKYSADTFYGFEEQGKETAVREERAHFISRLEKSFLEYPFVRKHFPDPQNVWDTAATPQQDGSARIIDNLTPAATNSVKVLNYVNQLDEQRQALISRLGKYYHSDNLEEKHQVAFKKSNELQIEFNRVFGRNPLLFSFFIKRLLLSEEAIYNYIHDNLSAAQSVDVFDEYTLFRSQFPQLRKEYSRDQNLAVLKKALLYSTDREVEDFLTEQRIDLNKVFYSRSATSAETLTNGLFSIWSAHLSFENFQDFSEHGLSQSIHEHFVKLIEQSINELQLPEFLRELVEKKTQGLQVSRESEEFLATVCASYLNDFVVTLGFNFMREEQRSDLVPLAKQYNLDWANLFMETEQPDRKHLATLFGVESERSSMADQLLNPMINQYNQFIIRLKLASLRNCGFVNYDIHENALLGELLSSVKELSFTLNK
jgi:hypothetical protein